MQTAAYLRLWLPLSIVFHVVLLLVLWLVKIPPVVAQPELLPVGYALNAVMPSSPSNTQVPPAPVPTSTSPLRVGVPNPTHPHGTDPQDGVIPLPGPGGASTAQGSGTGRTRPPALLMSSNGQWNAAPGYSDGHGTGGTDAGGEDGPSLGVAALGSPFGGHGKIAGELNVNGYVIMRVTLSKASAITDIIVSRSSGNDALDKFAQDEVRKHQKDFTGTGNVRVRFTVLNGKYTVEEVQ